MSEEKTYLELLARRDIKPTAIRLLVLKELALADRAFSLLDLEDRLVTVLRSSSATISSMPSTTARGR